MSDNVTVEWVDPAPDPAWDAFVASCPGASHLQTSMWGQVKATVGFRAMRVCIRRNGERVAGAQVLVRRVPVAGGVGYVPRGPVVAGDPALGPAILDALAGAAAQAGIVMLKIQPPLGAETLEPELRARGYRESSVQTAPIATVRIQVAGVEDDALLAAMRQTKRHGIRKGERGGVQVRRGGADDLPILHEMLVATGQRQGFSVYPVAYFRALWDAFAPRGHAHLLIAEHEGAALSSGLLIGFGADLINKLHGWTGARDAPPSNEPLQWAAIRLARELGHAAYDMEGITAPVARALLEGRKPPEGKLTGVSMFKVGFGGEIVTSPVTYDAAFGGVRGRAVRALAGQAERSRRLVHLVAGRAA
jgi:lipid II:glycine glycyltransferase (peptidoglycan interpeptide bridge formation enzyme)